jgi:hypothetical protein
MGDPVADLHLHTTASDGTLTLADLPAAARRAGLDCVAVTDHDRVHPGLDARVTSLGDLTVVRGVELRVDAGAERVDLLGYGVREDEALRAECDRLQRDRVERGRRIVDCVEARLGVSLAVDLGRGVGRPHVARAVADATDYGYDEVFEDLVGEDCPCYVARDVPDFETGATLLRDACDVVALAHPLRYDDPAAALDLAADLDAVERNYPYDREVDLAPVDGAVERHDLLATGGSDAHGEVLGAAGLDAAAFAPVARRLGIE